MAQHRQEDQQMAPPAHEVDADDFPTAAHPRVGALTPPAPGPLPGIASATPLPATNPRALRPVPRVPPACLYLDGSNRVFDLRPGGNVIGRGHDVDIQLDDSAVSGRHLDIRWDGDRAVLQDIGSTNGTGINGRVLDSEWTLSDGDVISLGRSRLIFQIAG